LGQPHRFLFKLSCVDFLNLCYSDPFLILIEYISALETLSIRGRVNFCVNPPPVNRAYDLAQRLIMMVKPRNDDALEGWLLQCGESGVVEIANFARGLQKVFSALQAALTLPYSSGSVEGQITKLKRDLAFHVWSR